MSTATEPGNAYVGRKVHYSERRKKLDISQKKLDIEPKKLDIKNIKQITWKDYFA